MIVPIDKVVLCDIVTSSSTGAAVDADSTPTFAVYEDNTDTDIGVGGSFTKRTSLTGCYRAQFTASAANGFEPGKYYTVIATATVATVVAKCVVHTFRCVAAEVVVGYPVSDAVKLAGQAVTAAAGVTFPTSVASPTNITAGTLTTVTTATNLTNAPPDEAGVTTLLARLSSGRATNLDNLDATVSSRSTYAGGDTSGVTTLLTRLSAARAGYLDVLNGIVAAIWAAAVDSSGVTTLLTRIASALTLTGGKVDVNDKTGFGLSSGERTTLTGVIWGATDRTLTSFGSLLADMVAGVWAATGRTLSGFGFGVTVTTNNDKSGYTLTPTERTAIADEVERQIIDETDSEKVLQAIVDKIAAANPSLGDLTLSSIASAVRTSLATELARIDVATSTRTKPADVQTIGNVVLAASQPNYAPATAGAKMDIVDAPNSTAVAAIQNGLAVQSLLQSVDDKTSNLPVDPASASTIAAAFGGVNTALSNLSTAIGAPMQAGDRVALTDASVHSIVDASFTRKVTTDPDTKEIIVWTADGFSEVKRLVPTRDASAQPIISLEPTT